MNGMMKIDASKGDDFYENDNDRKTTTTSIFIVIDNNNKDFTNVHRHTSHQSCPF